MDKNVRAKLREEIQVLMRLNIFGRCGLNNDRTAMLHHLLETSGCQLSDDN